MAYTPDYFNQQYNDWLGAQRYKAANPAMFRSTGAGRTFGDSLVQQQGIGAALRYAPARNAFGGMANNPQAQGYANYLNANKATSPFITEFAGYLERNKGLNSNNVLADLGRGNIGAYSSYVPEFTDWRGRETTRSNAQGFSGFNSLIKAVGPALVTGGASLPLAGKAAVGAAFGGASGGLQGALTGAAASALAPQIKFPSMSSIASSPLNAIKSVASQVAQPTGLLRTVASVGAGAANPTRASANYKLDPAVLRRIQSRLGGF